MTAPIQEPTLQRKDAVLTWGQNQLFRRPDPGGAGTNLPYAYMEWLTGADVTDDAELGPQQLDGGTPYEDCFVNTEGSEMEEIGFIPDLDTGVINFCSPGLYIAQFMTIWADTWTDGTDYVQTRLQFIGESVSVGACCSWATREPMFNDWQIGNNVATGMFVAGTPEDCDINPQGIRGTVWQKSGGDKFLSQAALVICKLAEFNADDGSFCVT